MSGGKRELKINVYEIFISSITHLPSCCLGLNRRYSLCIKKKKSLLKFKTHKGGLALPPGRHFHVDYMVSGLTFAHSLRKYLQSSCKVPSTVPGPEDTSPNKAAEDLALVGVWPGRGDRWMINLIS